MQNAVLVTMKLLTCGWVFLLISSAVAQEFRNLDFESPNLPAQPDPFANPFASLFPGWRGFVPDGKGGTVEATSAWYDTVWDVAGLGLSDRAVESQNGWGRPVVLSGRFSALMVASAVRATNQLSFTQTGLVPADSKSLRFRTTAGPIIAQMLRSDQWQVRPRIDGEPIEPVLSSITDTQMRWAVDISRFAGYTCWGAHSSLGHQYAINGVVTWTGNSVGGSLLRLNPSMASRMEVTAIFGCGFPRPRSAEPITSGHRWER